MIIRPCRHYLAGRVAPVALAFQCLAVLAVPLALCCCLAMATEGSAASPHAAHDAPAGVDDDACPHHNLDPSASSDSSSPEAGCHHLDRLIIALAGLIGVTSPVAEIAPMLSFVGPALIPMSTATDGLFPVESPPPRA